MRQPVDVLLLDADLRQTLVCARSLGGRGLSVSLAECPRSYAVPSFSSRWSTGNVVLPEFETEPEKFVFALIDLLDRRPARVLIPSHDGSIAALRPRRADLEARTALALAAEDALNVANDKAQTLALARELSLDAPESVSIADPRDVREVLSDIGFPAVIKPAQSWVSDGDRSVRLSCRDTVDVSEAEAAVGEILAAGGRAIAQPWAGGARESVSIFYAHRRVWGEFAQVAHRMYPMLGGTSVLRESIAMPADLRRAAYLLVEALNLEGYSEIEFRRDRTGRPLLMEINARLSASLEVAVRAGVDFPALIWRWAAGETLSRSPGYRTGVRMRWLSGDVAWLAENISRPGRPDSTPRARALGRFFGDFFRPSGYDMIDRHDLRPVAVGLARGLPRMARTMRAGLSSGQKDLDAHRRSA